MMKRKWWIAGILVLVIAVSLCFFGVRLRIAPRLVLSRALGNALETLEERFEDSPWHLLEGIFDPEGRQQVDIQLETEQAKLGVIRWDLLLHTQLSPNCIRTEGTVVTGGKALNLMLYLDENFAALSSRSLVQGNFYGITYDTFSEDIRSRPFLAALIGDKKLVEWENSVSNLADILAQDITLPEFTAEDIRTALYGAMAWKPKVSRIHTLAGETGITYAVSFAATGQAIAEAAEPYRKDLSPELSALIDAWKDDPEAVANAMFFLRKGKLIEVQLIFESSTDAARICATLGNDPATTPLNLELKTQSREDLSTIRLNIDTASNEDTYQEKLLLTQTTNGIQKKLSANYSFDLSSREMDLTVSREEQKASMRLNLEREGEKLTVRTQNISPLLNLFLKKPMERPAICTLTIASGAEIPVPEYRNLDTWSMEDLFTLLESFGVLLGLKLP